MMKKRETFLLLGFIFLTLIGVQGNMVLRNTRCSCIDTIKNHIHLKSLMDLKRFAPTSFCEKPEVIAVLKSGKETCLNPDSAKVKKLIKAWEKQVNQRKRQKKGGHFQRSKKGLKPNKSQHPHQKKTD